MTSSYSGLYAKTCAMRSKLLTQEDYNALAASGSIKVFLDRLNEFDSYKDSVQEAIEFGTNRVAIERSLVRSLYRDYGALYSFMTNTNERRYFDVFFLRYEIGVIKRLFRRVAEHRSVVRAFPRYENFFTKHMGLNLDALEQATDIKGVVEALNGSEFYKVVSNITKEDATLFDYEMHLDFYGYVRTANFMKKYLSKESKAAQEIINGADADLHNIMWIYRARTTYSIDPEFAVSYIIPINYRISTDTVKKLISSENDEQFMSILDETIYKNVFTGFNIGQMESDFTKYMNKIYDEQRRKHPFSLQPALTHIYFKGQEIRNITTLLECVRYSLQAEEAIKKIEVGFVKAGDGK